MRRDEVTFPSGGLNCAADLYLPDDASRSRPGLVLGHGFSIVKEALAEEARYFCAAGYAVLAIDYRSFGRSEGQPRGQLFPRQEVEDFRNAITYLRRRPEVNPEQIGIWGVSYGGGIVLQTAAFDRRVKAVVAQSPIVNGRLWMRALRSGDEWELLLQALEEDFEARYSGEEPRRVQFWGPGFSAIPMSALLGDVAPPPFDPGNPNLLAHWELLKTHDPMILLESVEKVIDFAPDAVIDMIAPRPLLIVANTGYDQIHFLAQIQDAFKRAGEPKKLVLLPYDAVGLYQEPGRGEAMREAIQFFHHHLPVPS